LCILGLVSPEIELRHSKTQWITFVNWIIVAIAVKIVIAGGELFGVRLEKAA
jgi:hypothetical protein